MSFDLNKFVSDLQMTPEDKAGLEALFGKYPTAPTVIDSAVTAEVDARLTPLRTQLESKQADLDAQFETLASIRNKDSEAYDQAVAKAEKLSGDMAVLKARIQRIGTDTGVDVEPYLKDLTVPEPKPSGNGNSDQPAFDPAKFMAEANRAALNAFTSAAEMEDLAQEHQTLFGKPLSRVELIGALRETVKRTGNGNLGLRDVWEQKYNVGAKRSEQAEADVQRRITEAVKKRETELADEAALRGTSGDPVAPPFVGSPALAALTKDQKPRTVGGVSERVASAIADYDKSRRDRLAHAS